MKKFILLTLLFLICNFFAITFLFIYNANADEKEDLNVIVSNSSLIVVGKVVGAGEGEHKSLRIILAEQNYQLFLPPHPNQFYILEIEQVLKGLIPEEKIRNNNQIQFYAFGFPNYIAYMQSSPKMIWILNYSKDADHYWLSDPLALLDINNLNLIKKIIENKDIKDENFSPLENPNYEHIGINSSFWEVLRQGETVIPKLRKDIRSGSPEQKEQGLLLFEEAGIIPLIPVVIESICDTTLLPRHGDYSRGFVGHLATMALSRVVYYFDGIAGNPTAPSDKYSFYGDIDAFQHPERLREVQLNWRNWWRNLRK